MDNFLCKLETIRAKIVRVGLLRFPEKPTTFPALYVNSDFTWILSICTMTLRCCGVKCVVACLRYTIGF